MPNKPLRLAVTPGEPAGIGPDLVIQLAQQTWPAQLVAIADSDMLAARAEQLKLPLRIIPYQANHTQLATSGELLVQHQPCKAAVTAGKLNPENGHYVVETLRLASQGNMQGEFDAVVTGPVHKGNINQGGISFSGHTEYFANQAGCSDVVMMLATQGLRVVLATTHIPLAYVAKAITRERLHKVLNIVANDLQSKFALSKPHIFVCGLNPHAGEDGHIGREELEVIIPALNELREQGMQLTGPLPADTMFQPKYLEQADAVLAMYHDQGLPVLKHKGFGASVNITLGLPFIRTSVDHGTALDLAGTGQADIGSFALAVEQAIQLAANQ